MNIFLVLPFLLGVLCYQSFLVLSTSLWALWYPSYGYEYFLGTFIFIRSIVVSILWILICSWYSHLYQEYCAIHIMNMNTFLVLSSLLGVLWYPSYEYEYFLGTLIFIRCIVLSILWILIFSWYSHLRSIVLSILWKWILSYSHLYK